MVGAKIGWKLVLTAFTVVVGLVANKAVTTAWKLGAGGKPPKGNEAGYVEVVSYAIASGAAAAAAKLFAERRAAQYWYKSTGNLPPDYKLGDDDKLVRSSS